MINDDLLNKFDNIEDLPVSEEILGAYIEGNLQDDERTEVVSFINHHQTLQFLTDELGSSPLYADDFFQPDRESLNEIDPTYEDAFDNHLIDNVLLSFDSIDALIRHTNEWVNNFYSDSSIGLDNLHSNNIEIFSEIDDSFLSNDHSLDTDTPNDGDVF